MKSIILYLIFLLLSFFSCSPQSDTVSREEASAQLQLKLNQINEFIAEASCTADGNCAYIPYGSKACGGPQGYLIYPSAIDETKLEAMVADYTEAEERYNEKFGIASDCRIPAPPGELRCENGICKEAED
ncbi:hypothetical protein RM553_04520 [Zunongwangia sp. F363]|uniref:Lipoprotein n=1 Tax=Autumnicola tepida TaxID=3075595 RepID=A0ABU3C6Z8_9FLAO|nr:hypothetical protein [Zunongwangia sp. F363]MDT0642089.1 hypothetical protein [Zunongwangia sp. F363]